MPSLIASLHLLFHHLWLGLVASLLFAAGLGTSVFVVRRNVRWLMALPLWIVRQVLRVIGPGFPAVRVFLMIFCFNCVAIFLYMVSGVLIFVPAAVAFLTGLNIGVIVLKAGEVEVPGGERPLAAARSLGADVEVAPWVSLCSLVVLLLELPCFWVSVGMGIALGRALSTDYTLASLWLLLEPRMVAYGIVIVPLLFLSALAETAAIRGHVRASAADGEDPPKDD